MPDITTLLIAYNEQDLIGHQLDWCSKYSDRIVVYDNESTDDTVKISKDFGADVFTFSTGGEVCDRKMIEIFNCSNQLLVGENDWMFCHSVDEFIVSKKRKCKTRFTRDV